MSVQGKLREVKAKMRWQRARSLAGQTQQRWDVITSGTLEIARQREQATQQLKVEYKAEKKKYKELVDEHEALLQSGAGEVDPRDLLFDEPPHQLGEGGFGVVLRSAEGGYHGSTVAVKLLKEEHLGSSSEREVREQEFFEEATLLASLRHDNIVGYRGLCRLAGAIAVILEYVPVCLGSIVHHDEGFDSAMRLSVVKGVASAMAYLHAQIPNPIIHRDLKPENVLLKRTSTGGYMARVTDYGLASRGSRDNECCGTPPYIAPEVLSNGTARRAADVFSFGMMLVDVLDRTPPFRDLNEPDDIKEAVLAGRRPVVSNMVRPDHRALMQQCWAQNPIERPSFSQILALLADTPSTATLAGTGNATSRRPLVGDFVRVMSTHSFPAALTNAVIAALPPPGLPIDAEFTIELKVTSPASRYEQTVAFTEEPNIRLEVAQVVAYNHFADAPFTVHTSCGDRYLREDQIQFVRRGTDSERAAFGVRAADADTVEPLPEAIRAVQPDGVDSDEWDDSNDDEY